MRSGFNLIFKKFSNGKGFRSKFGKKLHEIFSCQREVTDLQDCPQKCSINIGIIMNFEELHIEQRYSKKKKNVYFNFSIRDDFIVCNRDNFNIKIGGEGESAGNPISYLDRLPSKA